MPLEAFKNRQKAGQSARFQIADLSPDEALASAAGSRPTLSGSEEVYDTPHFQIHYTPSGADAVDPADQDQDGIPDYIQALGTELEYIWQAEIDTMGWLRPPSDISIDGHPDYDVYLIDMDAIGYAAPEQWADQGDTPGDNENSPGVLEKNAAASFIALKNSSSIDLQKGTAAHEFNHAIQFGYDVWEEAWLMEATATWIMDEVHSDINYNLGYLPSYFSNPDAPLHSDGPSTHLYGDWIFLRYISEHYGGQSTIRRIWESSVRYDSSRGNHAFNAIEDALSSTGASLATVFDSFIVANYVRSTTPNNTPYCYQEATSYPGVYVEGRLSYTGAPVSYTPPDGMGNYGADYIEISSTQDYLGLRVKGDAVGTQYSVQLVGMSSGVPTVTRIPMSGDPASGSKALDVSGYDILVLVVANETANSAQDGWATYTVEVSAPVTADRLTSTTYPNPGVYSLSLAKHLVNLTALNPIGSL